MSRKLKKNQQTSFETSHLLYIKIDKSANREINLKRNKRKTKVYMGCLFIWFSIDFFPRQITMTIESGYLFREGGNFFCQKSLINKPLRSKKKKWINVCFEKKITLNFLLHKVRKKTNTFFHSFLPSPSIGTLNPKILNHILKKPEKRKMREIHFWLFRFFLSLCFFKTNK